MKKFKFLAYIAIALFIGNPVVSQVEKGKVLLGARSDLNAFFENTKVEITQNGTTTESDGGTGTRFGFTPTAGYFFMDGFAGGLFMNVGINNSKEDQVLEDGSTETLRNNNTSFKIGPFLRYYIEMDKVKPFAHLQLGFGSNNYVYDMVDYDFSDPLNPKVVIEEHQRKYNLSTWGIGAGAAFFITNAISVDVMLGYNQNTTKFKNDDGSLESKTATGGFGLDVGFSIVIP